MQVSFDEVLTRPTSGTPQPDLCIRSAIRQAFGSGEDVIITTAESVARAEYYLRQWGVPFDRIEWTGSTDA